MSRRYFDAIRSFRYQQIRMLLNRGIHVDVKNSKGQTGLMIVCTMSNVEPSKRLQMFRYLIKLKAEPLEVDSNHKSVFHYACEAGDDAILRIILRMYNSNAVNHIGKDKDGRTAMHFAVRSGKLTTAKTVLNLFMERFISLDVPDMWGVTPLIEARKLGFEELANFLVVTGRANPHICDTKYHRNSEEWARLATKRKRQRVVADLRAKSERRLIYPRGRIKMRKIPSLLDIRQADLTRDTTDSINNENAVSGRRLMPPMALSRSTYGEGLEVKDQHVKQTKVHAKTDQAVSLLELSSKMRERQHYLTSYIACDTAQSQRDFLHHRLPTLFNVYSHQLSPSFCKEVRIPAEDETFESNERARKPRGTKISNLAVVFKNGKEAPSKKWNLSGLQKTKHVNRMSNTTLGTAHVTGNLGKHSVLPGIRVVEAKEDNVV